MLKKKKRRTQQEINELSKQLKRRRKHKGKPSGHRFNKAETDKKSQNVEKKDPRVGSKKPIPLIVNDKHHNKVNAKKHCKEEYINEEVFNQRLSPEQELEQFENDPYLEELLEMVENEQTLTAEQQAFLDKSLNRIEELMQQLGYIDN